MAEKRTWPDKYEDAAAAMLRAGDSPAWLHAFVVQARGLANALAPAIPSKWNPVDSFYPH